MKTINLSVQEQNNFCLCSVMQAIFRRHGLEISQEEIAENLTPSKVGFLPADKKIKSFMLQNGFSYSCFGAYETPFNEPYEVLQEMCQHDGMIGMDGHAYLVKDFHDPLLVLIDPKNKREVRKYYSDLLKAMGHSGFFGLVKRI